VNTTYQHLDSKLKVAELTIGQWIAAISGVLLALVYGFELHPFGTTLNLFTTVYVGGIPVAAVFAASMTDFDLWLLLRSAVRWRRADGRYLAGPGAPTAGYRLTEPVEAARAAEGEPLRELDLETLWGAR
jgi:hypothetical protein